jgi:hypothetical protein
MAVRQVVLSANSQEAQICPAAAEISPPPRTPGAIILRHMAPEKRARKAPAK